jgi:wobble nucleotide-excising tRNase
MGKSLIEIAQELKKNKKKVQLIYAFNGIGKTRLSRTFKELVSPKHHDAEDDDTTNDKVLYYNAFTEDLFYWDNDLKGDKNRRLKIRKNSFTPWVLEEEGQDKNITANFQHYTCDKLTPHFNENNDEIIFSVEGGNDEHFENIKISKGEESCFIWCIFYSLLIEVLEKLNEPDPDNRSTNMFDNLEYIFIDDPVSSLDENHLIEMVVNIAELIKKSKSDLKFIITTHNPLFYNVLYNELGLKSKNKKEHPCAYLLDKNEDGTFEITPKFGDSNRCFSYHLFLKQTIEEAIESHTIQKYHFTLLRNLYEKTANFLGYPEWSDLLPDNKTAYYNRIIQFTSHSTLSNEAVAEPNAQEKQIVSFLLKHLKQNYNFWEEEQNDTI